MRDARDATCKNRHMQTVPLNDHIALRIRAMRHERDLTREALSVAAGVSLRTLSRIEAGEDCKITTLESIARALDCPLESLVA